jgi:predicted AAA+ superfamily ATPase
LYAKPKSLILQCKAASKLKAVKKRFDGIVKQRTEFSTIANSLLASHPARDMNHNTANMTSLPTVDVASVLGRDQEKHQIISELVETNDQQRIKTVSIIGLGGSGKTTLAKLVFNDCSIIEKHLKSDYGFMCHKNLMLKSSSRNCLKLLLITIPDSMHCRI